MNPIKVSDSHNQNSHTLNGHSGDCMDNDCKSEKNMLQGSKEDNKKKTNKTRNMRKLSLTVEAGVKVPGCRKKSDQFLTTLTSVEFTKNTSQKIAAQKFPCFIPKTKNKVKFFAISTSINSDVISGCGEHKD